MIGAMEANQSPPIPLGAMARRLRIPAAWLRQEAEAGRIPHLKAGAVLLFDPQTVEALLRERAKGRAQGVQHEA